MRYFYEKKNKKNVKSLCATRFPDPQPQTKIFYHPLDFICRASIFEQTFISNEIRSGKNRIEKIV